MICTACVITESVWQLQTADRYSELLTIYSSWYTWKCLHNA